MGRPRLENEPAVLGGDGRVGVISVAATAAAAALVAALVAALLAAALEAAQGAGGDALFETLDTELLHVSHYSAR
jgi:hypothetical protein